MCHAAEQGNALYDDRRLNNLLSMDDVIILFPDLNVEVCREPFVRFSELQTLVDLLQTAAVTTGTGGVFVVTPYSFGLLSTTTTFLVFDSHAHGDQGARMSIVQVP